MWYEKWYEKLKKPCNRLIARLLFLRYVTQLGFELFISIRLIFSILKST